MHENAYYVEKNIKKVHRCYHHDHHHLRGVVE